MTAEAAEARDRLLLAYRGGAALALLFDYDGTLVPIATHPRMAILEPEARQWLRRLAGRPRVWAGVLSGRRIDELKEMVGVEGLYYVGTSGLEVELRERRLTPPGAERAAALVAMLAQDVRRRLDAFAGVWVEHKPLGLAVHYRDAAAQDVQTVRARVVAALEQFADAVRAVEGPMALEITPALGWTKGTAVRQIVAHLETNNLLVLYAGDQANDADAFEVVAAMNSVGIGVGPEAPAAAEYRLADPGALRQWLARLATALESRPSAHGQGLGAN